MLQVTRIQVDNKLSKTKCDNINKKIVWNEFYFATGISACVNHAHVNDCMLLLFLSIAFVSLSLRHCNEVCECMVVVAFLVYALFDHSLRVPHSIEKLYICTTFHFTYIFFLSFARNIEFIQMFVSIFYSSTLMIVLRVGIQIC